MSDSLAPDVAEHLLDLREADSGPHAAVAALLVAAAGPAQPGELTGEDAALRGFRQSYRARRRRRVGLFAGAAVAVLSLGGTAYAAGSDHLPDPVQRTVESLFGGGAGGSTAAGPGRPPTAAPQQPPPSPSASAAGRVEELCRMWAAARADPHAPHVTDEDRRILAQAARSATGIDDYCRGVLADPSPSARTPGAGHEGSVKPGNGDPGGGTDRSHPVKPSHP